MGIGFAFWGLGGGLERFYIVPKSLTVQHREHFYGYRQEEAYVVFNRFFLSAKFGYVGDIELVNEEGEGLGTYSASFVGINTFFTNASLGEGKWVFGAGPGILYSRIYTYPDWAITFNALAYGRFENGKVILRFENAGKGSILSTPEVFAGGYTFLPSRIRAGGYLRLFGDGDLDVGLYLAKRISVLDLEIAPSQKYVDVGFSLGVGPLKFSYKYTHSYHNLGSHLIGMTFYWGVQKGLEERVGTLEVIVERHGREIERLKRRIQEMENLAKGKAQELLRKARLERDPEKALKLAEMALVFHPTEEAQRVVDSLQNVVLQERRARYVKRINAFLKRRMYADAYAEALLFVREFPDDPRALKLLRQVEVKIRKKVRSTPKVKSIKDDAVGVYTEKIRLQVEQLLKEGKYLKAWELVQSLPSSPEKIALQSQIRAKARAYLDSARVYMKRREWVKAKAFVKMYLRISPDAEAQNMLNTVDRQMEKQAEYHYMKALESYQKGDILGAYAHAEEAYTLQPDVPKYRKIYRKLEKLFRRYGS